MEQAHGLFKLMQAKSLWNSMRSTSDLVTKHVGKHQIAGGGKAMSDEETWNVDSPVTHNHYHTTPVPQPQKQSSGLLKSLLWGGLMLAAWYVGAGGLKDAAVILSDALKSLQPTTINVEQKPATTVESPDSDYELGLGKPQ